MATAENPAGEKMEEEEEEDSMSDISEEEGSTDDDKAASGEDGGQKDKEAAVMFKKRVQPPKLKIKAVNAKEVLREIRRQKAESCVDDSTGCPVGNHLHPSDCKKETDEEVRPGELRVTKKKLQPAPPPEPLTAFKPDVPSPVTTIDYLG